MSRWLLYYIESLREDLAPPLGRPAARGFFVGPYKFYSAGCTYSPLKIDSKVWMETKHPEDGQEGVSIDGYVRHGDRGQ